MGTWCHTVCPQSPSLVPNQAYTIMAHKKSIAMLNKALAKAQNENKQDQMEKALLKVQEVLQHEDDGLWSDEHRERNDWCSINIL